MQRIVGFVSWEPKGNQCLIDKALFLGAGWPWGVLLDCHDCRARIFKDVDVFMLLLPVKLQLHTCHRWRMVHRFIGLL